MTYSTRHVPRAMIKYRGDWKLLDGNPFAVCDDMMKYMLSGKLGSLEMIRGLSG